MTTINQDTLAAGNLISIKNVQFQPVGRILQRKIVIVGTFDPAKVAVVPDVLARVFSPNEVADTFGDGSMLHRLAIKAFLGSKGLETWVVPQAEAGGATASDGTFAFSGAATEAKNIGIYIAGELYATVPVAIGDDNNAIAAAVVAALDANTDKSSPVTQAVDGVNLFEVDFTAKTKGLYGDDIDIFVNLGNEGELPAGVGLVVTDMGNGSTNPNIQPALDALGTLDNQNQLNFTALIHGYGQDTNILNAVSTYNGIGNDFLGNFSKTVARPFRSLFGDVAPGGGAKAALIALADTRLFDRTNGVLAIPGSQNHPQEIAALAMGDAELVASTRAEENYINRGLSGIRPGDDADRWTSLFDDRDLAVKSGISPTLVKNGVVTLQNVVSFYRPAAVDPKSNGFRSMRNIAIIQNLLFNEKNAFAQAKWQGITIVSDISKVTNTTSRLKARDVNAVIDELLSLAKIFEANAWIFAASFTIDKLKEGDKVVLRGSGNGFDITLPVVLSGEGGILNQEIEFDTSLAVFL